MKWNISRDDFIQILNYDFISLPAIKVFGFSVIFLRTSEQTVIANRLLLKSQMNTLEYELMGYRHELDFLGRHLVQSEHDSVM